MAICLWGTSLSDLRKIGLFRREACQTKWFSNWWQFSGSEKLGRCKELQEGGDKAGWARSWPQFPCSGAVGSVCVCVQGQAQNQFLSVEFPVCKSTPCSISIQQDNYYLIDRITKFKAGLQPGGLRTSMSSAFSDSH